MPQRTPAERKWTGIRRDIDCHGQPVEVICLADLHIGDPGSNQKKIDELIQSVKDNENRYAILGGDLMNTAIANSKSDSYSERLKPSEQLERCAELLAPIRDKILCIVPGNHEERITRSVGVDMTQMLARELELEDVFCSDAALLFLHFGLDKYAHTPRTLTYSIYCNHGRGGGRKVGSKLSALQEYAMIVDADCFVVGHTHLPASFKQSVFKVRNSQDMASLHEQLFVNTASSLTYGGYGKRGGYQPASNSYPVITLDNTEHHMTVTL
ncbi:MAG: metallophosphoesterase [Clostridiales bacterium]|nr:metallophosphoesterase [Clostridiales bacterium]